jgi:hypothetical protein
VAEVRRHPAGSERAALLLEVPHGATRAAEFDALAAELRGPFPEGLRQWFFVNTDVGAPEVAARLAELAAATLGPVWVIRSRIPRTFVDCNRAVDASTRPSSSAAGAMTPGVAPYVRDARDLALLLDRHAAYRALVEAAYEAVCGAGGTALMVHSYAPREVDVAVDERIVERIREAYRPGTYEKWPERPEVDLITRAPDGVRLADDGLVARALDAFAAAGVRATADRTYALHPSTMGHLLSARWPGRTLCLEMRRDLLAREFTPFAEMAIDPAKAERMAEALAAALGAGAAVRGSPQGLSGPRRSRTRRDRDRRDGRA